jgi:hypothetical protein
MKASAAKRPALRHQTMNVLPGFFWLYCGHYESNCSQAERKNRRLAAASRRFVYSDREIETG